MAESYENWYGGSPSSLEEKYGELFSGYKMKPERVGTYTHAAMADQINQISAKLREGMKTVEMSSLNAEVFETIPQQQFKQISELAKSAGAEITAHTPFSPPVDLAGFGEEGWSERNRKEAVERMGSMIDRLHEIKPDICVTIHPTHIPSIEWSKAPGEAEKKEAIVTVNKETGKMMRVEREERFDPNTGRVETETPEELLEMRNNAYWHEQVRSIDDRQKEAMKDFSEATGILNSIGQKIASYNEKIKRGEELSQKEQAEATQGQMMYREALQRMAKSERDLQYVHSLLATTYDTAHKYDESKRDMLEKDAEIYRQEMKMVDQFARESSKDPSKRGMYIEKLGDANTALLHGLIESHPRIFDSAENFAKKEVSQSLSEIALKKFNQFGQKIENTPVLAIENVFPNWVFGRAEELKQLIDKSREKFVEQATRQGIDKGTAKEAAKKIIGATWDVAHINMLRGKGFSKETIIEETKKIAPYTKKVHWGDNFGFAHTGLAPGMGNVPVKETLQALEKAGFSGKAILELHGLQKHGFKEPTMYPYGLEAIGSPLYYPTMAEYWTKPLGHASELPGTYAGFFPVPNELGGSTKRKYIAE